VKLSCQYKWKNKVLLYLSPTGEEEKFNPALVCALKKAIQTHHGLKPQKVEGGVKNVILYYSRPVDKAPDTLAQFGREFLYRHAHIHSHSHSCIECKKRMGDCEVVRACHAAVS